MYIFMNNNILICDMCIHLYYHRVYKNIIITTDTYSIPSQQGQKCSQKHHWIDPIHASKRRCIPGSCFAISAWKIKERNVE